MATISLRNITKTFAGNVRAVSELSLEVRDGQFMVIVGPSGCGKTTTLRLIAGLETPTSGDVCIADRVVNSASPRDRDVAMVFQDGILYPHMSVYANLAFPLRMRKQPEAEVKRRVGKAIEMLGIADLVNRKPAALSGGQRQRVALGRAIVREPAVFLFDEPLSNLDATLRMMMRSEIKALHQRLRTTTLYVTHDQSEAMALAQCMCVLRDGRVQQVGPPGEVYDRPANRFVAGFFGTPAMNFLTGRVRLESEMVFVDLGSTSIRLPPFIRACLADHNKETVVVGIRPHDLLPEPIPGRKDNLLCGKVSLIEPLGSRTDVHIQLPSAQTCVMAAPPHIRVTVGDEVRAYVNPEKLHLFTPGESGKSITRYSD